MVAARAVATTLEAVWVEDVWVEAQKAEAVRAAAAGPHHRQERQDRAAAHVEVATTQAV